MKSGRIKEELLALKRNNACCGIAQAVTAKGKNNEAAMIFIVREDLMGTIPWVKVKRECMRLMVCLVICTSQFAVYFDPLTFPCLFLLDPPMVRHTYKHVTSLSLMEFSKGS